MLKNTPENYKRLQALAKDCNALGTPYTFTAFSFPATSLNELHLYITHPKSYLGISTDDYLENNTLSFCIGGLGQIKGSLSPRKARKLAADLALTTEIIAKVTKLAKKHGIAVKL